ncbi:GLG2 [[Candida] subhashii]|uniref:glycogenin glucosyltransferase n=1 Tax=[Candida] subhashii TaxID=561895 RepID=A0A8J5R6G1_9ASCO|nr:GLG2 [[Candida] subhashii]KAG7665755.1 GLG2 [[Candida] subhashii]
MTSAYVTLLTGQGYLPGVLTLGKKLKELGTKHKLVILLDSSSIPQDSQDLINEVYDEIISIDNDVIVAPLGKLKEKLDRSELSVTFSKILLWNLTQFEQLVYLDADVLPLQNLDEIFEQFEINSNQIAASPDSGWPDIFNSGVFKLRPNTETFNSLVEFSNSEENTFDGADQGLLNEFFANGNNWIRLPYLFNVTPNYRNDYQYLPAFHRFFNDIRILHYIGAVKPWHYEDILSSDLANFHQYWWDDFNKFFGNDAHLKYKLLNLPRGEASNLKFAKNKNLWDVSKLIGGPQEDQTEHSPLFPWEHREEKREATRVFHPTTPPDVEDAEATEQQVEEGLAKDIETVKLSEEAGSSSSSTKAAPLSQNYGFEKPADKSFNPDRSLAEVAKLPFRFFSKAKAKKEDK